MGSVHLTTSDSTDEYKECIIDGFEYDVVVHALYHRRLICVNLTGAGKSSRHSPQRLYLPTRLFDLIGIRGRRTADYVAIAGGLFAGNVAVGLLEFAG
jgi:hypothetical protein